jgi:4-amino-4-deoxy-L-arabinose transferase-like glycosyltransferase
MVGVLLLSASLFWYDLGAREVLGRDENLTILNLDQPDLRAVLVSTQMRISGEPSNMQPFYFFLQYPFWELVGRSAFVFRFLSSAFGVLGVAITYKLGEALLHREVGLVGAFLTALLPLYVRYGQIARPYTLLALLALASAYFLVRGLQANRLNHWAAFLLAAALAFYTHYNAIFFLIAEGLFAGIVWLTLLAGAIRRREPFSRLLIPAASFLLLAISCIPGLVRLSNLPWVGSGSSEGVATQVVVKLTAPFFLRLFNELGLTSPWLWGVILVLMALGLAATLYQRRWQSAVFSTLWLAVPFLVLAVMKSPRPFEERYVIFVPPVAFLLVGQGTNTLAGFLKTARREQPSTGIKWIASIAMAAGLALLFIAPLRLYYSANRSADQLEQVIEVVESQAEEGDAIVVSTRVLGRPLAADAGEVIYLARHLTAAQLDELVKPYQRIWILYTSFVPPRELQEPLDLWVQAQEEAFMRIPIKAPSALAYRNLVVADEEAKILDEIQILEALAKASSGKHNRWVRHTILADTYQALGDLYNSWGDTLAASEAWTRSEEIRAAVPPPW